MVAMLACACASVTRRLQPAHAQEHRLAAIGQRVLHLELGSSCSAMAAGIQRSGPKIAFTPMKCGGATPITVKTTLLSRSVLADDVLRAAEARLPGCVVHHRDGVRARSAVLFRQRRSVPRRA